MTETQMCNRCHEELGEEPVRRGDKMYCCEACAFEASRSVDCGGRSDSNVAQPTVEKA